MKKIVISAFLVCVLVIFGYQQYRARHPRYIPPPPRPEVEITIIPGWNLRQVADYLVNKGFASSTEDIYKITGEPALDYRMMANKGPFIDLNLPILKDKMQNISYEGYLAPETYRVFVGTSVSEIIKKLINQRNKELLSIDLSDRKPEFDSTSWHDILIMASLVEKEAHTQLDRQRIADILWRRVRRGMALQVDSSVHYAVDKTGTVFTTSNERAVESPWNTYKYPGLPLGPICNPSLDAIRATLYPFENSYWYFLSGKDGKIYYAKTLEEHNRNKKYL